MRQTSVARRATALLASAIACVACTRGDPNAFSGYAEGDFVYVGPAVSGRVIALDVVRGQRVEKGKPLFSLEPDVESLERAAAAARVEAAAAQAANLRKGKRVDEIRAVEQQLAQAKAALELSTGELTRSEKLVKQGFLSPLKLDELRATRDRDAARVGEMQSQLATAKLAARPDEIAAAEAEHRAAENEFALTRWREQQTRGVAPANAIVQDVLYRVGEWVAQGVPVIALLPDGAVKLRFFVPQESLSRVRPGDTVQWSCDGCPTGQSAKVRFVSTQAEFTPPVIYSNESRSKLVFMVEAQPDAAVPLAPGQPIDVRIAR